MVVTAWLGAGLLAAAFVAHGREAAASAQPSAPSSKQASIATLPPGHWLELPNTKISNVAPKPAQRGWLSGVVQAWSGGAVDTVRSRLLVWGGGHGDYWGNEIYALDLNTQSMRRIVEPSPSTASSNCTSALPDGSPTSRHTYSGLTYIAHTDQLFSVNGSLTPCGDGEPATWTYDFGTSQWRQRVADSGTTPYGTMAVYDPQTRDVYVKDTVDFLAYSTTTHSYTTLNRVRQPVDYHLSATIDTKRRKFVMIGDGVQVIDLKTHLIETLATRNAPAFVTGKQSPGIGYDPVADRIVAWHGGSKVYALDMDTATWTQVAVNAGPSASAPEQGTFGRWGYVPQHRVFVLVNDVDQNAWVFRLAK